METVTVILEIIVARYYPHSPQLLGSKASVLSHGYLAEQDTMSVLFCVLSHTRDKNCDEIYI